jgi:hypothetical protein
MDDSARQYLVDELQKNRERTLALIEPLTTEQWNFKPEADRWSINQVVEHVVTVETRVMGFVQQKAEGTPETGKRSQVEDAMLIAVVPDRSTRRQAPEMANPSGKWPDREVLAQFENIRAQTCEFTALNTKNLREFFQPHGAFGELDCYQWMMLLALHGERHARQIEEVQASPGYPKTAAATA